MTLNSYRSDHPGHTTNHDIQYPIGVALFLVLLFLLYIISFIQYMKCICVAHFAVIYFGSFLSDKFTIYSKDYHTRPQSPLHNNLSTEVSSI